MNNHPDQNPRDPLLDAVLRDESWEPLNAAAKAAALRKLSALRRRQWQWTAATAALAAVIAAAVILPTLLTSPQPAASSLSLAHALSSPPDNASSLQPFNPSTLQSTSPAPAVAVSTRPLESPQHITEAQMLALFPKGSCLIAEINGQEQLIFIDRKVETQGAPYPPGS
ncbi:MAG: hypothetical protein ABSH19_08490 [Opitutales bacterium]